MIKGLLVDIDGVLLLDNKAIEGSVGKLNKLKQQHKIILLTNTTCKSIEELHNTLINQGFNINVKDIFSPPLAAIDILKQRKIKSIYPLFQQSLLPLFNDFEISHENPEALIIGDIGNNWNYELLNKLFKIVYNGCEIIALHKGKYWQVNNEPKLDIGLFIHGLEYVTGSTSTIVGKPSKNFFLSALSMLQLNKNEVLMIGDDVENDIAGAQNVGIKSVLVKSGKYKKGDISRNSAKPDFIIDSFKDLLVTD